MNDNDNLLPRTCKPGKQSSSRKLSVSSSRRHTARCCDDNEVLPNTDTAMKRSNSRNLSVSRKRTTVRFDDSDDDDYIDELCDDVGYVNDVDYVTRCDDYDYRRNRRGRDQRTETDNRRYESRKDATCARDSQLGHDERGRHRRRPISTSAGTDSDSSHSRSYRRQRIKPAKFDGSSSFETFYATFVNCADYNDWTEQDRLAHLKASLIGEAGQVLWDSSPEATDSLSKLTELLRNRFGGSRQADKYRMELRLRRRKNDGSLSVLHRDIRRLMALAHPDLPQVHRENIACDYFIDSLNDPDFALKVRERNPGTLDDAMRIALQLEAWHKDASRQRSEDHRRDNGRVRGMNAEPTEQVGSYSELKDELAQLRRSVEQLHCVQKKTPTHIFFHISMNYLWI